ncbi:MAG: tetratricopeptide repeat protein, partial [Deltaproteobacteria bacterium]|nr:tetratricopeptide repeat protein [Deltaproteobacteria bacterium]
MKVSCDKIIPLLTDYMFEDIEQAAGKEVEAHLEYCSECRQILADYKTVGSISNELVIPELPQSFDSSILNMAKNHLAEKNYSSKAKQDNVIPFYNKITRSKVSLFVLAAASIMFFVTSINKDNHKMMLSHDQELTSADETDNKTVTLDNEQQRNIKTSEINTNDSYNNAQSKPVLSRSRTSAANESSYSEKKDKLNIKGSNPINSDDLSASSAKRKMSSLSGGGFSSAPSLKSAPATVAAPVAAKRSIEPNEQSPAKAEAGVSSPKMSAPQSSANAVDGYGYSKGTESESARMDEDMDSYSASDGEPGEKPGAPVLPVLNNNTSDSFNSALALYNRGNCKESTAQFESSLNSGTLSSNKKAEALFYIGKCMSRTGKCSTAIIRFNKILSDYPSFTGANEVKWDSAKCYIKLGQTSKA